MRRRLDVELPEIEDIMENPRDLIMKYFETHESLVSPIAEVLLGMKSKSANYYLDAMMKEGILAVETKPVKLKSNKVHKLMKVWSLNEPVKKKGIKKSRT